MGRSTVLSGRIDARDRAHQRHRNDRRRVEEADPYDQIEQWLDDSPLRDTSPAALEQLDLDEYLRNTGATELHSSERLRHLAIHLELQFAECPEALDRIYAASIRLDPGSPTAWHSRAITAKLCAQCSTSPKVVERCKQRAFDYLLEADALLPDDPDTLYSLGKWHDCFGTLQDALELFDRVLELESTHVYARLHRAYCLHDLGSWAAAEAAYTQVPLDGFTGSRAFIVDVVLENLAYCKLRAGDRDGALKDFERLLTRLEKEPRRVEPLELRLLRMTCLGPLSGALRDRYLDLAAMTGLPTSQKPLQHS